VKNFITRIRKANRRRIAVMAIVMAAFYSLNWGLAHLLGMALAHNPNDDYGISDAAAAGYFVGFLAAFSLIDLARGAEKYLSARFGKQKSAATE
jgi:hypothetical protein